MCTTTLETRNNHENDLNINLRPMYSESNLLTRSDGSALLAQGIEFRFNLIKLFKYII